MKNLINEIMSLIFLGSISSVSAGTTESLAKTDALIHLENCFDLARNPDSSLADITREFKLAIQDKGDDPGRFDKLSEIAKNLGADDAQLQKMWCEYGLTDEGHDFFLSQPRHTKEENGRLVAAIRSALK